MRVLITSRAADRLILERMCADRTAGFPREALLSVLRIVAEVRKGGDRALARFTRRFDRVTLRKGALRVGPGAIRAAWRAMPLPDRAAMRAAWGNILAFHRRQVPRGYVMRTPHGRLEHTVRPLSRVGIHVPAGSAPLVSSFLMCAAAARAAGVRELVVASPPRGGRIAAPILAGAWLAGVREAYAVGGAHGVAALVFGTETVRRVDKVVGPGNIYTQLAKVVTQGGGLEGASEILVVADDSASPATVAADLLAQAEHAGENPVLLVTPSRRLVLSVLAEVNRRIRDLPRSREAAVSLSAFGTVVLTRSVSEAMEIADAWAPEHLAINARGAARLARRVRNAGTVLVGPASAVAAADYGAGPNHVLPTSGTARYASGLGVRDFTRTMNVTELSPRGLRRLAPALARLARMEGLEGHARSVEMERGKR